MRKIGARPIAAERKRARPHGAAQPGPVAEHAVSPFAEAPAVALTSLVMRALQVQQEMVAELLA
jgi:hypothetical protein